MNKVMIVDDESSVCNAVEAILRFRGCEVRKALRGTECLGALRSGFTGVVLMDITMPGLSGWDTIRSIVSEGLLENVVICMLTGHQAPGPESQGLEEAVFDYLPKPFGAEDLYRMVDSAAAVLAK